MVAVKIVSDWRLTVAVKLAVTLAVVAAIVWWRHKTASPFVCPKWLAKKCIKNN